MLKWIAKPFLWLVTSAIPVFIAACYGPRYAMGDNGDLLKGTTKDDSGKGIPDIEVKCINAAGESIDATYARGDDGYFSVWSPHSDPCKQLRFTDVDGEENGVHAGQDVDVPPTDTDKSIDVVLSAAE